MTPAEVLASLRGVASNGIEWIKQRGGRASARLRGAAPKAPVAEAVAPVVPAAVPPEGEEIKPAAVRHRVASSGWSLWKKLLAAPTVALIVAVALAFKQWVQSPIAIESFMAAAGAPAGLSSDTIADQLKGHITEINAISADLYETRKLGTASVPLDIRINDTEWTLAKVAKAFNIDLASIEVSGRVFQRGDWVILQATTVRNGDVVVDTLPVHAPVVAAPANPTKGTGAIGNDPFLAQLDVAVNCVALRVMERVSPDVAANYLFKTEVQNHPDHDDEMLAADGRQADSCLRHDDIELYSSVANDPSAHTAERIKALVGLSLHYSNEHETYEELNMALAATALATRAHCDDPALNGLGDVRCRIRWFFNRERNIRAEIAAWMQLGAARSDYAATQDPAHEANTRREAIAAYQRVIDIQDDYGLAYDAIGVQTDALHDTLGAFRWFNLSLRKGETPAAHVDLGWLYINRRNAFYGGVSGSLDWLAAAQVEFEKAIKLMPDYWSAHQGLGYALLEHGYMTEAIDVLKPAAIHDISDLDTRRHLGSAFAGACRFKQAEQFFRAAYVRYAAAGDGNNQLNTLTDWGKALDEFGARQAAVAQEEAVLQKSPGHVYARQFLGQIQIASVDPATVAKGLAALKTAVDADGDKQDFVLQSYLIGLTETGHSGDAVKVYREWSGRGLVPPLGVSLPVANAPPPRNQLVRLGYAKALVVSHQWQQAVPEFDMLAANQIEFTRTDIADLAGQARAGGGNDETLHRIDALTKSALPDPVDHRCHDPRISETTPLSEVSITEPADAVATKR
jgi:tetratricopeptide (TPR) repeat protein